MIDLTYEQKKWLNSRGGRNISDVREDKRGFYVMFGLKEDQKVYIPKGTNIKRLNKIYV